MSGPDTALDSHDHGTEGRAARMGAARADVAPVPGGRVLLIAGAIVVVLLGGTAALWAHVGTAIFFETIRAGVMACFG